MPTKEDENKPKVETQKGPETPEQAAAQAALEAQAGKEGAAANALAEAEKGEGREAPVVEATEADRERQAREIAEKWIAQVPEADRKLTDPKQVENLVGVLKFAETPADGKRGSLFTTRDHLGNLPGPLKEAAFEEDPNAAMRDALDKFLEDPYGSAGLKVNKAAALDQGPLPDSVKRALFAVIMEEGERPPLAFFKDVQGHLKKGGEGQDVSKVFRDAADRAMEDRGQADQVRQDAARQMVEGIYPDLAQSQELALLRKIWSEASTAEELADAFKAVVGKDYAPSERAQARLQRVTDDPEEQAAIRSRDLEDQLVAHLAKRLTTKKEV